MRGAFEPPAFVLWFAVTVWIAGFDLIYACQDVEFDRAQGLHSVPPLRRPRRSHGAGQPRADGAGAGGAGLARARPLYWVGWLPPWRCSSTSTRWSGRTTSPGSTWPSSTSTATSR